MNYAKIRKCDVANGPGVRVSLFVSGCNHHCKNCFNREAWDFTYGEKFTEKQEKDNKKCENKKNIRITRGYHDTMSCYIRLPGFAGVGFMIHYCD